MYFKTTVILGTWAGCCVMVMTAGSDVKCFLFFSWGEERGEEGRVWGVRWRHGIRPFRLNSLNWSIKFLPNPSYAAFLFTLKLVWGGLCNLTWSGLFFVRLCDLIQFNGEKKTEKALADEIEPSAQEMALWSLWALKQTTPDLSFLGFCSAVWIIHELRRRYPHLTPVRLTLKLLTARDKLSRDGELLPARLKLHVVLCASAAVSLRGEKAKLQKRSISFEEKKGCCCFNCIA